MIADTMNPPTPVKRGSCPTEDATIVDGTAWLDSAVSWVVIDTFVCFGPSFVKVATGSADALVASTGAVGVAALAAP